MNINTHFVTFRNVLLLLCLFATLIEARGGRGGGRGRGSSHSHSSSHSTSHSTSHNSGGGGFFSRLFGGGGSKTSHSSSSHASSQPHGNSQSTHSGGSTNIGSGNIKSQQHGTFNPHHNKHTPNLGGSPKTPDTAWKQNPSLLSPSSKAVDSGWKITPKTASHSQSGNPAMSTSMNSGYGRNPAGAGWNSHVTNPQSVGNAGGHPTGNSLGWKPGVGTAAAVGVGVGAGVGAGAGYVSGSKSNSGSGSQTNSGAPHHGSTWNTNTGNQHQQQGTNSWNTNSGNLNQGTSWNQPRYPTQTYHNTQTGTPHYGGGNNHVTNNIITNTNYVKQTPNLYPSSQYHYGPHFVSFNTYSPSPYYCSWLYGCPRPYITPLFGYQSSTVHHHYHNGNSNTGNYAGNTGNPNQPGNIGNPVPGKNPNETSSYTSQPVVYNYQAVNQDTEDSSEIKFLNPYLIVGLENMVLYGEFQNNQHITVYIEQDSDGLLPLYFSMIVPDAIDKSVQESNHKDSSGTNRMQELKDIILSEVSTPALAVTTSLPILSSAGSLSELNIMN